MWRELRETSARPQVVVAECHGDLEVRGSDEPRVVVRVEGGEGDLALEQDGDRITLRALRSCWLVCPAGSTLTLGEVHGRVDIAGLYGPVEGGAADGDVRLRAVGAVRMQRVLGALDAAVVGGELSVQHVAGDATLRRVDGPVTLREVAGDLEARALSSALACRRVAGELRVRGATEVRVERAYGQAVLRGVREGALGELAGSLEATEVEGTLQADAVHGAVHVRQIGGRLTLGQVGGSLRAGGLAGGLAADRVGGEVRLAPPFTPGATYRVRAGGQARVEVPADASLRLLLRTGGRVRAQVPGLTLEPDEHGATGVVGAGEAALEIEAGGDICLRPQVGAEEPEFGFDVGLADLGEQIEARVEHAMLEMEARLAQTLGQFDPEGVRQRVEWAAGQRAAQWRRQAERAAERARMRAEQAERRWRRASGQSTHARRQQVSDEERLRVLRLVEVGKITPQQAAELLAALEGR